jgi:hypothetical protein
MPAQERTQKNNWIQFRTDDHLDALLNDAVARLAADGIEASRSLVARMIIREHLEGSKKKVTEASIDDLLDTCKRVVNRIVRDMQASVPTVLSEELRSRKPR